MAFFTFFSLFPLLLIGVSAAGLFFSTAELQQTVADGVRRIIPRISRELVYENLSRVLDRPGEIGLTGVAVLLWTGTASLTLLTQNLSRAWPDIPERSHLRARLVATGGAAILFLLMGLFSLLQVSVELLLDISDVLPGASLLHAVVGRTLPPLFVFVTFVLLYRYIPKAPVSWRGAVRGALFATLGTALFNFIFGWYLRTGVSRYNVLYGSLGSVVIFLTWLYVVTLVVLVGAHLCAQSDVRPIRTRQ